MRTYTSISWIISITLTAAVLAVGQTPASSLKPRLLVHSDIGNEPDDEESFVRLLCHANEYEIEGMIATTSQWMRDRVEKWRIEDKIDGYEQVLPNLKKHADGWPEPSYLRSITKQHLPVFGMQGVGDGKDTEGSDLCIQVVDEDDPRPVWVVFFGGPNCFAQALYKVKKTRTPEEVQKFVDKVRLYGIEYQDDSNGWIVENFKANNIFYIFGWTWRGISSRGGDMKWCDGGWIDRNVQNDHGALGAKYPDVAYIQEGDTPSFLYIFPCGLGAFQHPDWGSWGGRYIYNTQNKMWNDMPESNSENYGDNSMYASVYRWREHFANEFEVRMDWCVKEKADANHPPVVKLAVTPPAVDSLLGYADPSYSVVTVKRGDKVTMNAGESSDPDNNALSYNWMFYDNNVGGPSTYDGTLTIDGANAAEASFTAPQVQGAKTIHIILTVKDNGTPNLFRYRRLVVTVDPNYVPPQVSIDSFTAQPTTITEGDSVTLSWQTSNAISVSINNGVGTVGTDGNRKVAPDATTTYTLTAEGTGGPKTKDAVVTVIPSGPTRASAPGPVQLKPLSTGLHLLGESCYVLESEELLDEVFVLNLQGTSIFTAPVYGYEWRFDSEMLGKGFFILKAQTITGRVLVYSIVRR
jgi:hypothetical protein